MNVAVVVSQGRRCQWEYPVPVVLTVCKNKTLQASAVLWLSRALAFPTDCVCGWQSRWWARLRHSGRYGGWFLWNSCDVPYFWVWDIWYNVLAPGLEVQCFVLCSNFLKFLLNKCTTWTHLLCTERCKTKTEEITLVSCLSGLMPIYWRKLLSAKKEIWTPFQERCFESMNLELSENHKSSCQFQFRIELLRKCSHPELLCVILVLGGNPIVQILFCCWCSCLLCLALDSWFLGCCLNPEDLALTLLPDRRGRTRCLTLLLVQHVSQREGTKNFQWTLHAVRLRKSAVCLHVSLLMLSPVDFPYVPWEG